MEPKVINIPDYLSMEFAEKNHALIATDQNTGELYALHYYDSCICWVAGIGDYKSKRHYIVFLNELCESLGLFKSAPIGVLFVSLSAA